MAKDTRKMDEILTSLDGMKQAEMPPFFFTRLQARMDADKQTSAHAWWYFFTRPSVRWGTLLLLLLMNGTVFFYQLQPGKQTNPEPSGIQAFLYDYELTSSSIENTNTERP